MQKSTLCSCDINFKNDQKQDWNLLAFDADQESGFRKMEHSAQIEYFHPEKSFKIF